MKLRSTRRVDDTALRRHGQNVLIAPLVALALLAGIVQSAHAQWKWRDAAGRITASDLPPPREIPEKDILQRPNQVVRAAVPAAPAASPPAAASAPALKTTPAGDKELEARKRAADQEAKAKAKADDEKLAAARAENCRRARSNLTTIESGQRMVRTNDKGEREVLDDAGRADEARRAREVIASDCKP